MTAEDAIRQVIEKLVETWNREDWSSFSRLFAEDADYVTGAGVRLAGRRNIHEALSSRGDSGAAADPVMLVVESLRMVGPDAGVALCGWRMGGSGRAGLLTLVVGTAGDDWRIVALHNTDRTE